VYLLLYLIHPAVAPAVPHFKYPLNNCASFTMFTQAKAAVAIKDKKTRITKTRLTKERKEHFINLCLLAKKRDRTINLKQFHDSPEPELKGALGYTGWLRVVAKDPRIAHAFGTKRKNVDGNQDAPPPPGIFKDEDGDEYVYTCRCKIHKSLVG
jgi:hypothetical protein